MDKAQHSCPEEEQEMAGAELGSCLSWLVLIRVYELHSRNPRATEVQSSASLPGRGDRRESLVMSRSLGTSGFRFHLITTNSSPPDLSDTQEVSV